MNHELRKINQGAQNDEITHAKNPAYATPQKVKRKKPGPSPIFAQKKNGRLHPFFARS
jgi:hypothetical protein